MNLGQLTGHLGHLFAVDTYRYSVETRRLHLNKAVEQLEEELNAPYGQCNELVTLTSGVQRYDPDVLLEAANPGIAPWFKSPIGWYYTSILYGGERSLRQLFWEEFRATYPLGTEDAEPEHYTLHGSSIYFGPTPDSNLQIYCDYNGRQRELVDEEDTNAWTIKRPYLLLDCAAVFGAVHLFEDQRVKLYKDVFAEHLDRVVIELASAQHDGRRPEAEEP